jgi:phosphate-selective porin OprO/OprP
MTPQCVRERRLISGRCLRVSATATMVVPVMWLGAQTAPPPGRADDERGSMVLAAGQEMRLSLGGYLQVDGRWVSGTSTRSPDGLLLRRARLVFDAARADGWHMRLQPDFGQGRVQVQDAFVGYQRSGLTARAGRFRPAFGTERMQSSATLLAPERGLVNSLMPSRSFGAQLLLERGVWRIAAGGFRTPIGSDVTAVDTDGDVNAVAGTGHDLLLRVAQVHERNGRYLEVQSGVLVGSEQGTVEAPALSRVLSVAQQPILAYLDDGTLEGTARAAGARARYSAGTLMGTPRTVFALEGAMMQQRVARAGQTITPVFGAATVRFAHVWNGVRAPTQEITPRDARGALDVGVRAGTVNAWGEGLDAILSRRSATHAHSVGVAVSWLPTRLTRMSAAYDFTARTGVVSPREHALVVRWQQGF